MLRIKLKRIQYETKESWEFLLKKYLVLEQLEIEMERWWNREEEIYTDVADIKYNDDSVYFCKIIGDVFFYVHIVKHYIFCDDDDDDRSTTSNTGK